MFSQTAEYALRAVVFLAAQPSQARTAQQIAHATAVPAGYMAKVLQALSRAGLVHSQRGLHGGFVLAPQPDELTAYDVVQAVDPIQRINECPLGVTGHRNLCALHRRMDQAIAVLEGVLRGSPISALLAEPGNSLPLCSPPPAPAPGTSAPS